MHRVHLKEGSEGLCETLVDDENTLTTDIELTTCLQCVRLHTKALVEANKSKLEAEIETLKEQVGLILLAFVEGSTGALSQDANRVGTFTYPCNKDGDYMLHWYNEIILTSSVRGSSGAGKSILSPALDPKGYHIELIDDGYRIIHKPTESFHEEEVEKADPRPSLWSLL